MFHFHPIDGRSRFWDTYLSDQHKRFKLDLLKDADEMFDVFSRSIGAWEPLSEIFIDEATYSYVISLKLKNYGIDNIEIKITNEHIRVIGKKENEKFDMKWLLPPGLEPSKTTVKSLENSVEVDMPTNPNLINMVKGLSTMFPFNF